MGQKSNPIGNRLILNSAWQSQWINVKKYADWVRDDIKIRDLITKKFALSGGISEINIVRTYKKTAVRIHTSRPGIVIGRAGQGITDIRAMLEKALQTKIGVEVVEERKPDLIAILVAQNIGSQIIRRMPYRRAVKNALGKVMSSGAKGVRIQVSGRLNGAEIARSEKFSAGTVPLATLKQDIDFIAYDAVTTFGVIGIKVWINLGLAKQPVKQSNANS